MLTLERNGNTIFFFFKLEIQELLNIMKTSEEEAIWKEKWVNIYKDKFKAT